jgi:transposase
MMLYHLKSGYAKTRREAASLIGVHPKTVGTWLTVYETDGLEAMLHRGTPTGRPPLLTTAQADTLRSKLQEVEGFASYTAIQEYNFAHRRQDSKLERNVLKIIFFAA